MRIIALITLFFSILASPVKAGLPEKEIWIWLNHQKGAAYENGILVKKFDILSGSDSPVLDPRTGRWVLKPTPKGSFKIRRKCANYINQHGIEMPYSLFFTGVHAMHGWAWNENLPSPGQRRYYASSGCISLNLADIAWLFNWAEIGTSVHIAGERTYN